MLYEEWPLQGLTGQDSCCSKDPRLLPFRPMDLRLPSAQDRRCPAPLCAGLEGLSAKLEERDLRRLWEAEEQGPEGEEALELLRGTNEEEEEVGKGEPSDWWIPNVEANEGAYLGFLG